MNAKLLLLSGFWGILVVSLIAMVFVFSGVEWSGGNAEIPWIFLFCFVIFFLCFLVYWSQWPRPMAQYVARSVSTQDSNLTTDEAAAMVKKYSPILLVASLVFGTGSILAFITY